MRTSASLAIGAGVVGLDVIELPPHMAPAEGEFDIAALGELA